MRGVDANINSYVEKNRREKERDLQAEIPHIHTILDNMGTRLKSLEEENDILRKSMNLILPFATELGRRKLNKTIHTFSIQKIREEILDSDKFKIETNKDLLKVFRCRMTQKPKGETNG